MSKYKVTQEFMNALIEWRNAGKLDVTANHGYSHVAALDIAAMTPEIFNWRLKPADSIGRNKRLIAIIDWLDGEDVFEVEKPHKFVVRSVAADEDGDYRWMYLQNGNYNLDVPFYNELEVYRAKRFNTRMDAELWTTNGYEVIEIDGDGNEVE